ncbi:MAG: ABC transporter substrate-binding protein [Archaeoglobaceae archaeon]
MKRLLILILPILLLGCVGERGAIEEIRVSHQPGWHHVALFLIIEKGWDEKVLGKKIVTTSFPSGPSQMEAFAAKQHDIAYVGSAPPLSIISRGFDARIVAIANVEGSSLVSIPEFEFKSIESLNGKRIITFPPGSVQWTILSSWLKEKGIKAEIVTAAGTAEIREALKSKSVDLAFVPDPAPYVMVQDGSAKIVMHSREMFQTHPCCVVLMNGDFVKNNRELAVKFVALHIIASEYALKDENHEEIVKILEKWLKIEKSVADKFPGTTNLKTDPRDETWLRGLQMLCDSQFELGVTRDADGKAVRLEAKNIVDSELYSEALKIVPQIKKQLGLE